MATYTSKLNLKKPEGNELFNRVQDLNDNWDKIDAINASKITNTPSGNISSTNAQNAINELDTEKASKLFATNLVTNGDFSNGTNGWSTLNGTITESGGVGSFTATNQNGYVKTSNLNRTINHKYYLRANVKTNSNLIYFHSNGGALTETKHSGSGLFETMSIILVGSSTTSTWIVGLIDTRTTGFAPIDFDNFVVCNLTALFGSGNEPTKEQMGWIFTERDRLALGHLNGTQELLPMVSLLNLINKKANIAQEAWITPTLLNSWVDDASQTTQYYKDELGIVRLKGRPQNGTSGATMFTLPDGYRPARTTRFAVPTRAGGALFVVDISSVGAVAVYRDTTADRWCDLNQISFRVA